MGARDTDQDKGSCGVYDIGLPVFEFETEHPCSVLSVSQLKVFERLPVLQSGLLMTMCCILLIRFFMNELTNLSISRFI